MPNNLRFPSSYKQHITALQYSGRHNYSGGGHGEQSDYEPDGDNYGGGQRYSGFARNPNTMPKRLSAKYTSYISRSNKLGSLPKFR